MSTDLAVSENENQVPAIHNPYSDQFDQLALGAAFLPRVQLFTSQSPQVKTEKIGMNHYGFVTRKDEIDSLGKEVDVLPVSWRPRAIDFSDRANIRASSVVGSDLWNSIAAIADSNPQSQCMYGPEFLIWVPAKKAFATFLMGSKSARTESRQMMARLEPGPNQPPRPVTLRSKPLSNDKYTWQAPWVLDCSTPFEMPDRQLVTTTVEKFLAPPEQAGARKVEESAQTQRDR